jgi:hypothetical protein
MNTRDEWPRLSPPRRPVGADPRGGVVLVIVMLIVSALTLLGGMAFVVSKIQLRGSGYYRQGAEAFANADAGARYVLHRMAAAKDNGTLALHGANVAVNFTAPAGYAFDAVTNLTRVADGHYMYRLSGYAQTGRATIQVVVAHDPLFPPFGIFGDRGVQFKPNARVWSYQSSATLVPTAAGDTREARIGSNRTVEGDADITAGAIYLGEDSAGNPATYPAELTTAASVYRVPRIDPDPLGLAGGWLAGEFARVAASNDNARAVGGTVSGNSIELSGDVTLVAGDYYVSLIDIGPNKTLRVDASAGPVNIFLTGEALIAANGNITTSPALPGNLRLYSNSSRMIGLKPGGDFVGFIYAPLANVQMEPNGLFRGAVWGMSVNFWPGGDAFIDMDFLEDFVGRPLELVSWKEVTN